MWTRGIACFSAVWSLSVSASAQESDTQASAERAVAAFETWLETNKTTGVIALVRDGAVVRVEGIGRDPQAAVELASLSKSITGICANELVSQGKIAWPDTIDMRLGVALDIGFDTLLTHQSGLEFDGTQATMPLWLDKSDTDRSSDVMDAVAARGAQGDVGVYSYNNENYALAGLMIEAAAGRSYQDVCTEVAIDPAEVAAMPSARAGAFLPWGGWSMRAEDFALWHAHWFAAEDGIARDPKALPYATLDDGLYYGIGTTFRTLPRGNTFWHYGALCFPGRLSTGSYAATVFGDWTAVAVWDACVDWPAMFAVDQAIWGAIYERKQ